MSLSSDLTSLDTAIANVANDIVGYTSPATYSASNNFTITEFRLICS